MLGCRRNFLCSFSVFTVVQHQCYMVVIPESTVLPSTSELVLILNFFYNTTTMKRFYMLLGRMNQCALATKVKYFEIQIF